MSYNSINRVTLVGHLTSDPELRTMPNGGSVCALRLAVNGRRRNAEGGYDTKPNYFSVSVFGPPSENVHRYLTKGRAVAIDGRLDWHQWETAEQQKRQTVTIIATNVQFLGGSPRQQDGSDASELSVDITEEELEGVEVDDIDVDLSGVDAEDKPELVTAGAGGEDEDLLF